ncbi:SDR family NAD(P)-dependent oxidoreductase [Amycolatopsis sp. K13G38]|uniref:SDR family NAD(P)-dependent oxidoreductase n=1 Tax=Amycolatopsis acididurans TaxID=2724524 RepID=A0ABX1JGH6_9PSEU|nr:SDR family NAD(P)-dependent oxidoreductase [Amycolatopsis acididurans]NKQ57352.1 SDR family NAD(P)-dependent oxidoreductase [Amycolatopsis acididurans]
MILITGATDGLGRYVAGELVKSGERVIAHGRNEARLAELAELGAETVRADLAELRQVDRLADEILARHDRLDVLVNNAGIGTGSDFSRREESPDGVELRFAVNYLAGHHLTRRLLPLLRASAPAKVVNVASVGQSPIDFADPMLTRSYDGMRAYSQSKLAQIMFTIDLAEELAGTGVTVNALHPATMMPTTMVRESGAGSMSTIEEGGAAVLRLIRASDDVTGAYFNGTTRSRPNAQAADPEARRNLRALSERLVAAALG